MKNGALFPLFTDAAGEFWLGGSPQILLPLTFQTKAKAEICRRTVFQKNYPFLADCKPVVCRAAIIAAV